MNYDCDSVCCWLDFAFEKYFSQMVCSFACPSAHCVYICGRGTGLFAIRQPVGFCIMQLNLKSNIM